MFLKHSKFDAKSHFFTETSHIFLQKYKFILIWTAIKTMFMLFKKKITHFTSKKRDIYFIFNYFILKFLF